MKRLFLLVALVVAMLTGTDTALAQVAPPAGASPADRCALATSILEQLPPAPTGAASATPSATPVAAPPTSYADEVLSGRGIETSAGTISGDTRLGATFIGEMAGDLPGVLVASTNYTPPSPGPGVTNNVVGGEWALCGPWGTLFGTFTGGKVQWNADETLADIAVGMSVLGGSVNNVPVSGGNGTFGGVLDHRPLEVRLPPTVSGTLRLQASGTPVTGLVLPGTGGPSLVPPAVALLLIPALLVGLLRRFLAGS